MSTESPGQNPGAGSHNGCSGAGGGEGENVIGRELQAIAADPFIDFARLYDTTPSLARRFRGAAPCPHIVLEDLLPGTVVRQVLADLPPADDASYWRRDDLAGPAGETVQRNRLQAVGGEQPGDAVRELFWELNSGTFLRFLENLSGIEGLIADPKLHGAGVSQFLPGGFTGIHTPARLHAKLGLHCRLGLHLYLNPGWPQQYGGDLELWSADRQRCGRRLRPLAGRGVVFVVDACTYLGYPRPLACPQGRASKLVSVYYYSLEAGAETGARDSQVRWCAVGGAVLPPAQ